MVIHRKRAWFSISTRIKYANHYTHLLSIACSSLTLIFIPHAEAVEKKYTEIIVTDGGCIAGTVSFDGDVPPVNLLYINQDHQYCGKEPRPSPALEIHPANNGIKNVVVSIENISEGKPFNNSRIHPLLDQQRCTFIPHVLVITAGTTVDILNGDNLMHNVHLTCIKNPPFNLGTTFKQRLSKKFDFVETIKVSCDVHNWMTAWIVVKENPYFAITDEKGRFFIDDIPTGTYTLQAWHESLSFDTKKVTINKNEGTEVKFGFTQERLY